MAPSLVAPAPFAGFPLDLFLFLAQLERDNSREFMDANRARFEDTVRGPALAFVRGVAPWMATTCPRLVASDAKRAGSMLRMVRDVRFSADRRPYHDSVALRFPHGDADPRSAPHLGLRLTARSVEVSAGWRSPGPHSLAAVRRAIDTERVAWASVRLDLALRTAFEDLLPPELVRVPRDWPPDHPFAGDLRRKSFLLRAELSIDEVGTPDVVDRVTTAWAAALPLLAFLCRPLSLPWEPEESDESKQQDAQA